MPERQTAPIRDLSPPGEILAEALEERCMTNAELARRTGLSEKHVSQIINAHVPLSMDVALQLERVLGIPARLWNSLEFNYRAERRREEQRQQLRQFADWMRGFPIDAMRRAGYFRKAEVGRDVVQRVEVLLSFFGVTSPTAWEREWKHVTGRFRKSPAFDPDFCALTAWLRLGELEAQGIRCSPYDENRLREVARETRRLTNSPLEEFIPKLVEMCAQAGVALTFIPSLPKLAISGVTRWVGPEKALISLSLRYRSDDHFWFSFFHEVCHVLDHRKATIYVDSPTDPDSDPAEQRANQFARDSLVPPEAYAEFTAGGAPSMASMKSFAHSIGVSPGIVVGRLQFDRVIPFNYGNGLKRRFRWSFENRRSAEESP